MPYEKHGKLSLPLKLIIFVAVLGIVVLFVKMIAWL